MGWLGTYAHRRKISIDNTNIDSDLAHFPVLVAIGLSVGQSSQDVSDIFDEVGVNYLKIAITKSDGTTQIYGDIELWDSANEKAVIHVAKSDLDVTSSSVTELYIYFDSAQSDNTTYVSLSGGTAAQSVYDSNFVLAHHMAQDPSGTAPQLLDATANNNDGTSVGGMTSDNLVDGQIGKAIDFNGIDNRIDFGNIGGGAGYANLTVEVYFKNTKVNYSADGYLLNKDAGGTNTGDGSICIKGATEKLVFTNNGYVVEGAATLYDNWVYTVYTFSDPDHELFEHGISVSTGVKTTTIWNNSISLFLSGTNSTYAFEGEIGEVRISDIMRSDAWIKATHYSLTDDLITYSATEDYGVATPAILPTSGAYPASQSISMSCATSGASIYYTTDGSTPDATDSLYSAPFTLTSAKTVKAIGIKSGLTDSDIASETYTISALANQPIINILT